MHTLKAVNQIRTGLKMKLSNYAWYHSSEVSCGNDDYYITVYVKKLDNDVRKVIPPVFNGINVKTEVEKGN